MKEKINYLLNVLPYAFVFIYSFRFPFDSDLGWHLKQGEYLLHNLKIMDVNIYSSEMVGYQYQNYAWLLDAIYYLIFNLFSFIGISILGAITVTLIFFFLARAANLDFWQKTIAFIPVMFLSDILIRVSFRGQLLSIAFLALVIFLLTKFKKYPRRLLIIIPLIIVIWTNTHPEFILAILTILTWIFSILVLDYAEERKINFKNIKYELYLLAVVIFTTFLNPYTYSIYKSLFNHFYNPEALSKVNEWLSPLRDSEATVISLFTISIYILCLIYISYRKRFLKNLFYLLIIIPFIVQGVLHARYLWISIFLLIPIIGSAANLIRPINVNYQRGIALGLSTIVYIFVIYLFPITTFVKPNWNTYCMALLCSSSAAKYVIENKLNDKDIYTQYEFGGWLIWNYPDFKPSVDGRMHVWKDSNKYSAFLNSYSIEQGKKDINETNYKVAFVNKRKPIYSKLERLVKEKKWEKIYSDFDIIIYKKI